jgi:hypothetical protein
MDTASSALIQRQPFVVKFVKSKGPPPIVFMMILLALGLGSTIGVASRKQSEDMVKRISLTAEYDGSIHTQPIAPY